MNKNIKVDHRSYRCNFCSREKKKFKLILYKPDFFQAFVSQLQKFGL